MAAVYLPPCSPGRNLLVRSWRTGVVDKSGILHFKIRWRPRDNVDYECEGQGGQRLWR
jgi:hypothetical protein